MIELPRHHRAGRGAAPDLEQRDVAEMPVVVRRMIGVLAREALGDDVALGVADLLDSVGDLSPTVSGRSASGPAPVLAMPLEKRR